jgi:tetratricopeptide (TPR) repeat protein
MRRAIGLLAATEDTYQLARAHLACAQFEFLDGRPEQAGRHLTRAEPLLALGGDQSDIGVLRAEQARYAAQQGEAKRALNLATEAERLLGDDTRYLSVKWHALAAAHAAAGDGAEALHYFEQAVKQLEERGKWREAAIVAREWAALLRSLGRDSEAIDVLERAVDANGRTRRARARSA